MNNLDNADASLTITANDIFAHMQDEAANILEDARLALDAAALKKINCAKSNLVAAAEGLRLGTELSQIALWLEAQRRVECISFPKPDLPHCIAVASAEEHALMVQVIPELPLLRSRTNRLAARAKRLTQVIHQKTDPVLSAINNADNFAPKQSNVTFRIIQGGKK